MSETESEKRYSVVLTYSTMADSPEEAAELAMAAVADRHAYAEVFVDGAEASVKEGDLAGFVEPAPAAPSA